MTPKEKAQEIYTRFVRMESWCDDAQECALIAVDEILKAYPHTYDIEKEYTKDGDEITVIKNVRGNNEFWYKVKQEIEKL